jgi:membrane-associated phospholipid phosphatase
MVKRLLVEIRTNASFYGAYALFLVLGLLLLQLFGKEALFLQQNAWHHPWADAIAPWLTHLGDGLFAFAIFLVMLSLHYRKALTALFCFAVVLLVIQLSKQWVFADALRPAAYFAALGQEIRLIEGVKVHAHNSFPSGHSASAFVLFTVLALQWFHKKWGAYLLLAAVIIAYTRIYLSQHFMGDVLAGSLVGVLVASLGTAWLDGVFDRRSKSWHQKGLFKKQDIKKATS